MARSVVTDLESVRKLRQEAEAFACRFGPNAYSRFLWKHGRRPSRKQAEAIGRLLGARVRASDGSLQPPLTEHERKAKKARKRLRQRRTSIDAELTRVCDAIELLSRNELDPSALMERITPLETETVAAELKKTVKYLKRFAMGFERYVQNGRIQIEEPSSGNRD